MKHILVVVGLVCVGCSSQSRSPVSPSGGPLASLRAEAEAQAQPPQCYPTFDLFADKQPLQQIGNVVRLAYTIRPGMEDALLTLASYELAPEATDWLPQNRVDYKTFAASEYQQIGYVDVQVASCGAQVDVFRCDFAPQQLTEANIEDASTYFHLFSWDASPPCGGNFAPQQFGPRRHLFAK